MFAGRRTEPGPKGQISRWPGGTGCATMRPMTGAAIDGFSVSLPGVGDAGQKMAEVSTQVSSLVGRMALPGVGPATGCPETASTWSMVGSAATQALSDLAGALAEDCRLLTQAIAAYHLADQGAGSTFSSTASGLGGVPTSPPGP
jgi:hypothetical protein